jgi:hypothetical protein
MKCGAPAGYKSFLASAGLLGIPIGWIKAIGGNLPIWAVAGVASVSVSVGLITSYYKGRSVFLPDDLSEDMCADGKYKIQYSSSELLMEACEMTKPYYQHEYVPGSIAEQWRLKNPKAFVSIINSDGVQCASFGVLVLKDSFMDLFIGGQVSDTQLREENICGCHESVNTRRVYISGVVVRDPTKFCGRKRAYVLVWAMLTYLKALYGVQPSLSLFAVAVTPESERLMLKLGFQMISSGSNRVDKCNLYKFELDEKSWKSIIDRIGDLSCMCECDFLR